jgi:hypothetical protein
MISRFLSATFATVIIVAISLPFPFSPGWARGFGGGFRGGGYDRGYGDRGYGDRGFDDRGRSDSGFGRDNFDGGFAHPGSYADTAHPSESALRAGANQTYNWGNAHQSLASDSGFGALSAGGFGAGTRAISPAELASRGAAVRDDYGYANAFDRGWWGDHPDAWGDAAWGDGLAWGGTDWPALAGWWDMPVSNEPTDYDYGNNITYQNDSVYYGSQPAASTDAYYSQAQTLSQSVPTSPAENSVAAKQSSNWKPLGVFSLVQGEQSSTTMMFQLAVDKRGTIKGNYYNALTGDQKPLSGAVDKKTMRACWTVGGNKEVVYDTGLANLLQPQGSLLIHYGKDNTQQWTLVRLKQPSKKTA